MSALLRRYALLVVLLSALGGLGSCKKNPVEPPAPVDETATAALRGVVLDEAQQPVAGAQVQVGTSTATTTAAGTFAFDAAPVADGRCVVRVRKTGFFESVVGLRPQQATAQTQVTLTALGTPLAFTAGTATTLQAPGGLRVELPAGALTRNGAAYTGPAQAYVRYISPSDPQLPRLMPGGDLAALNAAGAAQVLITYGAVRVELEAGGQPLQLATGRPAELRFPAAGATEASIPLWHFDTEAGLWKEEGRATRTGGEYVGTVSHFSAWNLDMAADQSFVRGRLSDCGGAGMAGVRLRVGQTETSTDEQGYFGAAVPAGTATTIQTAWPAGAGPGLTVATVPALARQGVHELGAVAVCIPAVRGRLVDCSGQPVSGAVRLLGSNGSVLAAAAVGGDGRFALPGPSGSSVQVETFLGGGTTARFAAQLPAAGSAPAQLGDLRTCGSTTGGAVVMSFTLDGDGRSNELIELRDVPSYYDRPKAWRSGNSTAVVMGRSTQTFYHSAALQIPGTGVGTYQSAPGTLPSVLSLGLNGPAPAIFYETNTGASLTITVTQYDAVGGRIKGTFSGTLRKRVGTGPLSTTTVTVSNGSFDFPRVADQ
ncbi:hypothetical protein GCM10027048_05980 [Hymenobacter coalescens]